MLLIDANLPTLMLNISVHVPWCTWAYTGDVTTIKTLVVIVPILGKKADSVPKGGESTLHRCCFGKLSFPTIRCMYFVVCPCCSCFVRSVCSLMFCLMPDYVNDNSSQHDRSSGFYLYNACRDDRDRPSRVHAPLPQNMPYLFLHILSRFGVRSESSTHSPLAADASDFA